MTNSESSSGRQNSSPVGAATERPAALQAQQLLQTLLDAVPDMIYFKDAQSRFLKCSKALANRLGLSNPEQVVGKTDYDFHPPEKAREFFEDEQRIIKTGVALINKIEKKTNLAGEVIWTSTTKVPLLSDRGLVIGIAGINRDVTEQLRSQEALRQAHDQLEQRVAERAADVLRERRLLRTLIDNLPDAIYAKDCQGRKTLANRADLNNLRCKTEADALGKTDFDLFSHEVAARFFADDQQVVTSGAPVLNREEYFFTEDGQKRWLLSSKLPLLDEKGTVVGLVGIGRDTTSLKEAEGKLEVVHKQLLQASHQAGMAEVATSVLHNVGNVLNSVNVSAELIGEKLRSSAVAKVSRVASLVREHVQTEDLAKFLTEDERGRKLPAYLEQVAGHLEKERSELAAELDCLTKNIEHIKQIVSTQQNYARIAGMVELVVLPDLMEDALKIHGGAYMRHGVTVIKEYEENLPQISVDKHRMMQIVVNLLSNAKHSYETMEAVEKTVILRLKKAGENSVKFEVQDNGVGVVKENLTRIFSQGFTTRKGGHGFGLHSGVLAAREMGGSLEVYSEGEGRGTTFTLELPLSPPQNALQDKK